MEREGGKGRSYLTTAVTLSGKGNAQTSEGAPPNRGSAQNRQVLWKLRGEKVAISEKSSPRKAHTKNKSFAQPMKKRRGRQVKKARSKVIIGPH